MQRLEVSCVVRHIYMSLGAKGLMIYKHFCFADMCSLLHFRHKATLWRSIYSVVSDILSVAEVTARGATIDRNWKFICVILWGEKCMRRA